MFNQIATIMMSGILVALVFPMVIMPVLGVDQGKWITLMSGLSIAALPLTLLEYFYTKERVTLETQEAGADVTVPFGKQLRAIFSDKYMILIYTYFLIYTAASSIKNVSLVYYCNLTLMEWGWCWGRGQISREIPCAVGILNITVRIRWSAAKWQQA